MRTSHFVKYAQLLKKVSYNSYQSFHSFFNSFANFKDTQWLSHKNTLLFIHNLTITQQLKLVKKCYKCIWWTGKSSKINTDIVL